MKKTYIVILLLAAIRLPLIAQDTLAAWTFPTGTAADSIANISNAANVAAYLNIEGGTSAIDFSKNGFLTKAAQATGWDNGANTKAWVVNFSSFGYENLTISSRQQSGGNNPGPLNYQLQYYVTPGLGWIDVPGGAITTANDWTTSYVNGLALPVMISNHIQTVSLRWLMTTNTSSSGGTVAANGTDKIDDIYITGTQINIGITEEFEAQPHAWISNGSIQLENFSQVKLIQLYDISGRLVNSTCENGVLSSLKTGCYLLVVNYGEGFIFRQKLLLH